MWYKDSVIDSDWKEIYALVEQWENLANSNVKTAAIGDMIYGLGQDILRKTIQKGIGYMSHKSPDKYGPPAAAMQHYLKGTGEDRNLDEKLFTPAIRQRMLQKAIIQYNAEHNGEMLPPNTPVKFLWDYTDYTSSGHTSGDYIHGNEEIDNHHKFSPLRYIVGGFTAKVWYTIDRNKEIKVFLDMEDDYDWHGGADTEYNLSSLGILNNPRAMSVLKKIDSPYFSVNEDDQLLKIGDNFWDSLAQNGMAKSYKNKFKGNILSIPFHPELGFENPQAMLEKIFSSNPIERAIDSNSIEILEYLIGNGYNLQSRDLEYAVGSHNYRMVQFVLDKMDTNEKSSHAVTRALQAGNIPILNLLIINGYELPHDALSWAFRSGNPIEMCKFVLDLRETTQRDLDIISGECGKKDYWDLYKYAFDKGQNVQVRSGAVESAIKSNNPEMFDWLADRGGVVDEYCLRSAVANNSLEMLDHIVKKYNIQPRADLQLDYEALYNYNTFKSPDILQYVINELNVPVTNSTLQSALCDSSIKPETIDFLTDHMLNSTINPNIMPVAAQYSTPEVIDILVKKGVKPTQEAMERAAAYGNWGIVGHFLKEYHIRPTTNVVTQAMDHNQYVLNYIIENHLAPPDSKTLNRYIYARDDKGIEKMLDLGAVPDMNTVPLLVHSGNIRMLNVILDAYPESINTVSMSSALSVGTPEVISVLMAHGKRISRFDVGSAYTPEMKDFIQRVLEKEQLEQVPQS